MNPTKTLLTLLISLLPITVSAGELDGKSLLCEPEDYQTMGITEIRVGWRFLEGFVYMDSLIDNGLTVELSHESNPGDSTYLETRTHVSWWNHYRLDRKTLMLEMYTNLNATITKQQCEVMENQDEYRTRLKELLLEYQMKVDEEREGNKI